MTTKAIITKHDSGAIEVAVGNELYVFTDQEFSFAKRRGESVKRNRKLLSDGKNAIAKQPGM